MINFHIKQMIMYTYIDFQKMPFILSVFAQYLASHFGRSSSQPSYGYAASNDQPNCFASYSAIPRSLVKCPG